VPEDDDRDRPRKSWREIDAQRDRSNHSAGRDRRDDRPRKSQPSQKTYRAALDRLFESGGLGKLLEKQSGPQPAAPADEAADTRARLMARVRDALGPDDVTKAVDAYLAKFTTPPEDFEFLGTMLQHRAAPRVAEAMEALRGLLDRGLKPKRPRAIAAQLRMIEEVGDDPELTRAAAELRRRLG
jgi:hypothetical protein